MYVKVAETMALSAAGHRHQLLTLQGLLLFSTLVAGNFLENEHKQPLGKWVHVGSASVCHTKNSVTERAAGLIGTGKDSIPVARGKQPNWRAAREQSSGVRAGCPGGVGEAL